MSETLFKAAFATFLVMAPAAHAEEELSPDSIANMLQATPVHCSAPQGNGCDTVEQFVMLTPTRGINTGYFLMEIEPGFYLRIETTADFTIGPDGLCYSNISAAFRRALLGTTAQTTVFAAGDYATVSAEQRAGIESMVTGPMADMLDGETVCSRIFLPDTSDIPGALRVRTYLGSEIMDDSLFTLHRDGDQTMLSLIPG